jgi:adenylylsulfate kinase
MNVIWITGLAGAGKTSIARRTIAQLRARGRTALLLDGDAVRAALEEPRVDRETRLAMAYRLARLAQLVAVQDTIAVVATVSLFHEVQTFNRCANPGFFEVLVQCPLEVLRERCAMYRETPVADIVGLGQTAEFPTAPHLVVTNEGEVEALDALAMRVVEAWSLHAGL